MATGRWYLTSFLIAVLFWHVYGVSVEGFLAIIACLAIWVRTYVDERERSA